MLNEARKKLLNILTARIQKAKAETQCSIKLLGARIEKVDRQVVHLLARRKELAERVIRVKLRTDERIYRPDVEENRLEFVSDWAEEEGLSPEFARSLQYLIMSESRNVQVGILESHRLGEKVPQEFTAPPFEDLRANLLKLTAWWAPRYDSEYGNQSVATKLHQEFEQTLLKEEISELPHKEILLDIGCATGRETVLHTHGFKRAVGYDVSAHMIAAAQKKAARLNLKRVLFQAHDVEQGLPLEDNSVSFLYMNQGTASDIRNIAHVLEESTRVLKVEGRFLLSFYNAEALIYRSFLPWPPSLTAEFSQDRHCLDVQYITEVKREKQVEQVEQVEGAKPEVKKRNKILKILKKLPIFAKAYTVNEVQQLLPSSLECSGLYTHPTLSAALPPDVFQDEKVVQLIKHLDKELASSSDHLGAYIVLTGIKTGS